MKDKIFSLLDIETTGGSARDQKIIEIAVIQVLNGKVINTYEQLINPLRSLDPFIIQLTGIHPHMLANSPTFEAIAENLYNLLDGTIITAHNAPFDYSFLKAEFSRVGMTLHTDVLCTVRLSRTLFPELPRHGLDLIIEHFGFEIEHRHRAMGDTIALQQLFEILPKYHPEEKIISVIEGLLKKHVLPSNIPEEKLKALPDTHGVYVFYGERGYCLYVGKSIHMKERIFQHFAKAHDSTKEMSMLKQMREIETHETHGELGSLLLESRLIKEMLPPFNRRLRKNPHPYILAKHVDSSGYYTFRTISLDEILSIPPEDVLGIYASKRAAHNALIDLAKSHHICQKVLGIERSPGTCFGFQLHTCLGACVHAEPTENYNVRFNEAFEKTRLHKWPYSGPIIITESLNANSGQFYIFDKWCYLATGTFFDEDKIIEQIDPKFDKDIYVILRNFLKNSGNSRQIRILTEIQLSELVSL